jgi:redox-sensitive bicupin YhaK (pirin superfamily)
VKGTSRSVGDNFLARHFSEEMFGGRMDPLLMVDDFVMMGPTFAPHIHAGISVVTVLFEDSIGQLLSRDSLGLNIELRAGDVYWLAAASGAAHEEKPSEGARVHALQIFVSLPNRLKAQPARATHVRADEVIAVRGPKHRVRNLLKQSNEIRGAGGMPDEMIMLDGVLESGGIFDHQLGDDLQAWIYTVSGALCVHCEGDKCPLSAGDAMTIGMGSVTNVTLEANEGTHFVLVAAKPMSGPFFIRDNAP